MQQVLLVATCFDYGTPTATPETILKPSLPFRYLEQGPARLMRGTASAAANGAKMLLNHRFDAPQADPPSTIGARRFQLGMFPVLRYVYEADDYTGTILASANNWTSPGKLPVLCTYGDAGDIGHG
ncbi:hypothetical protein F4810DRAFT_715648 [Camillea tinctor]|nr:hypothetical protein F4810DRAFT_715648 [Camillea tinctor]